ncbi:GNAT family N-acetyltransferase [Allomuricauda sp. d1]|uniref:GNAT family N-acetyltransferase n=1 Tax=Allomuricauda sp. d1 TaxID=3136725 RepID=UPI0031DD5037
MKGYYISTNKNLLNMAKIHREVKASYWGSYRTPELTKKTIDSSICFGVFTNSDEQVGFGRVLTDKVVFAYIMDVLVFEPHKGKGLGKFLIKTMMEYPEIKNVLTIALKTKDAHILYESFGFKRVGDSELWMAIDRAKLD